MVAKFVLVVGVLGVGGYVGHKVSSHDPSIIDLPKAEVESLLASSKSVVPSKDGKDPGRVWGVGVGERGVGLRLRFGADAPVLECRAVVTAVAPDKSRVAPDCGDDDNGSKFARVEDSYSDGMFREHIDATIARRAFDRVRAERHVAASVLGAGGEINREAMRRADEAQRTHAELVD